MYSATKLVHSFVTVRLDSGLPSGWLACLDASTAADSLPGVSSAEYQNFAISSQNIGSPPLTPCKSAFWTQECLYDVEVSAVWCSRLPTRSTCVGELGAAPFWWKSLFLALFSTTMTNRVSQLRAINTYMLEFMFERVETLAKDSHRSKFYFSKVLFSSIQLLAEKASFSSYMSMRTLMCACM